MALTIFDLDDTLLGGDSDNAWGEFVADRGVVDAEEHRRRNAQFFADYKRGDLDIMAYLRFACEPLTRLEPDDLLQLRDEFVQQRVLPMVLPKARSLVELHVDRGDFPIIVTATIAFITRPIAEHFGVDTLIAPEPEQVDGRFTGEIVGVPSFREGKVTRIREWLKQSGHSLEGSYCYSDSHNDVPMLELVSYPHAVDPDPRLKSIAEARQWPVISLRD